MNAIKETQEHPLQLLILEDSINDYDLIHAQLTAAGFRPNAYRVENEKDYINALKQNQFDILLSDFSLPGFNAFRALEISKEICPEVPFICISGSIGEETAIELLKLGAVDYVLKDRPSRLPFAIKRALEEAKEKKALLLAEEELRKSESRMRDIIFNTADWVWEVDKQGRYTYSSQKGNELLGATEAEILGKTPFDFMPEEEAKKLAATFEDIVARQAPIKDLENWNYGKKGELICLLTSGLPFFDDQGELLGYRGIDKNITERKHAEQELIHAKEKAEESDRLKSAFLANMSHEIRTPMNGILGFASLLKEPELSGEQQQEYIRIIEKSGARMLNLINDIISISKIESGIHDIHLSETNINRQFQFINDSLKLEAESKKLQLSYRCDLADNLATIKTDPEKFYGILTNLIKNAIKYTDKGKVEFGYKDRGDRIEFWVKDTGIGIPSERQSVIFERFIQADIANKMARQGAGLGLSISKAYVEMLGGRIWIESEEGEGSTFYFTIARELEKQKDKDRMQRQEDGKNQVPVSTGISNLKILIAEDDEVSLLLMTVALKKISRQILKAGNGQEAIDLCREHSDIDLIMMDIQMPEVNGYEATRAIRKFNPEVVILAQTAFAVHGDREKALAAGCTDHISKPIRQEQLMTLLSKYFKPR